MKAIELITDPSETTYDRVVHNGPLSTSYTPADFVGTPDFTHAYAAQNVFVILNGGFVLAIVFGQGNEQDALDEAVDASKLDCLQITQEELKDYETGEYEDIGCVDTPPREIEVDGAKAVTEHGGWPGYDERVTRLGNASECFDQELLDIWILPLECFSEDPSLMTLERVVERLEEQYKEAETARQEISAESTEWLVTYRRAKDLKDALTLCHFAAAR